MGNLFQLLIGARPGRTVGQGSPDEGTDGTILIFLGVLTFSMEVLIKVGGFHINLGVKTIFLLNFDVQEREFTFVAPLTGKVQGGVSNEGIP